jgi:hypothetical protein
MAKNALEIAKQEAAKCKPAPSHDAYCDMSVDLDNEVSCASDYITLWQFHDYIGCLESAWAYSFGDDSVRDALTSLLARESLSDAVLPLGVWMDLWSYAVEEAGLEFCA